MTRALFLSGTVLICSLTAFAKKPAANFEIKDAYIFQPLTGAAATAGYGTIKNPSNKEITVEIVKAEGFKAVELHETVSKEGMMSMQKVESFKVPQKGSFELVPGGNHIMLFEPSKNFAENDKVKVTFKVNGKTLEQSIVVKSRNEIAPEHNH